MFEVELIFHGDLIRFLRRRVACREVIRRELHTKTAVKDVIEACGVPHTEVDLIAHRGEGVSFAWQVEAAARLDVYPVPAPVDVAEGSPRLQERHCARFVADGHLGKLARNLRLLGIDTIYERNAEDGQLLEWIRAEERALLTRDRPLLMHSIVRCGYCPRSDDGEEQTREVLQRFSLGAGDIAPFSLCLRCNHRLEAIPKSEVLEPLAAEPRTLRYYDAFHRCENCGQIYWPGTHFEKLEARVARLIAS